MKKTARRIWKEKQKREMRSILFGKNNNSAKCAPPYLERKAPARIEIWNFENLKITLYQTKYKSADFPNFCVSFAS